MSDEPRDWTVCGFDEDKNRECVVIDYTHDLTKEKAQEHTEFVATAFWHTKPAFAMPTAKFELIVAALRESLKRTHEECNR